VAWEKEFVLCEGTGHAGVGSVFDLSNATVARLLNAKVVIVTRGGIGLPIDEVNLNRALFEKEGVEVIGVILNKVLPEKHDYITEFAEKGLKRKGLKLLGVVPHQPILSSPTMDLVRDVLDAEVLNQEHHSHNIITRVVIGAMGAPRAAKLFRPGVLLIAPGDRDDILKAAAEYLKAGGPMAGIVLSDDIEPSAAMLKLARTLPCPVLRARGDSYHVASEVHDLTVKIRPDDTEKIRLVQDLIAKHVKLDKILEAI
jgi:BioD-like phosphotransacetylase family protein